MSKKVEFCFDLDQLVEVTATHETGVVTMLAVDDGGNKYYIQGTGDGKWWPERLLMAASN